MREAREGVLGEMEELNTGGAEWCVSGPEVE